MALRVLNKMNLESVAEKGDICWYREQKPTNSFVASKSVKLATKMISIRLVWRKIAGSFRCLATIRYRTTVPVSLAVSAQACWVL